MADDGGRMMEKDELNTFQAFCKDRWGVWPGFSGEKYHDAFARLCNTVAVYVDETFVEVNKKKHSIMSDDAKALAEQAFRRDAVGFAIQCSGQRRELSGQPEMTAAEILDIAKRLADFIVGDEKNDVLADIDELVP